VVAFLWWSGFALSQALISEPSQDLTRLHSKIRIDLSSQYWSGFARDAQHTALDAAPLQDLNRIHWQTPVDLSPQYSAYGELLIHYGSPIVTAGNTVIVPVKTAASGGFRIEAHAVSDGSLKWNRTTDYVLPPHNSIPVFGPVLTRFRVYFPGAGGTVYYRDDPDLANAYSGQIAFYGLENYQASPATYTNGVMINTPLTSDLEGDIYFGFVVLSSTPVPLQSGIARLSANGTGSWISAAQAAGDPAMTGVAQNCAPALSSDQRTLYVAVSDGTRGYLVALDAQTLAPVSHIALTDPQTGSPALVSDDSSASPTIAPDGDVYFGVRGNPNSANNNRGWLLHFDARLVQSKAPGAFGWDDTASLIPSHIVASYLGSSPYVVMTKYNNYADAGGDGINKIAVLDPISTATDPVTSVSVMKVVLSVAGPTPNPPLLGVKEWCINSAAVDLSVGAVLANNEDGKLYRWDLSTNTLSQAIVLTAGVSEAYTPTVIGPDGTVFTINNATLFAVGK
jgi:hypothetical protein